MPACSVYHMIQQYVDMIYTVGDNMLSTSTMQLVSEDCTHACQNYNTSQILMFDEYIKVRESLYT